MTHSRFGRFAWTLPLSAAALFGAAALLPACGGGSGSTSTGGSGGGGSGECTSACFGDTPVCDPDTKTCVGCLPSDDSCAAGQFCDPATMACSDGCKADADCTSPQLCDPTSHQCVSCTADSQCDPGSVCNSSGVCVAGCSDSAPCVAGQACCDGACADLNNDPLSCGTCGKACTVPDHAAVACVQGICQMGPCDAGFGDCDQNPDTGCETDVSAGGGCSCTPGDTQSCYTGPPGTQDIGTCKGGTSTCDPTGTKWGPCDGQVTPTFDTCADSKDNDCDGTPDNAKDLDGDGWTPCDGDCCDVAEVGVCGDPLLVNPGAFEVAGNMVDDDCDGVMDNPVGDCDQNLVSNSAAGTDYAMAIDLCQSTTESPANKKDKIWGVISGSFSLAAGSGTPAADSRSIRAGFGPNVSPLGGTKLMVLSTGVAAANSAPNNSSPTFAHFQGGTDMGPATPAGTSTPPSDWLAKHAGKIQNAVTCDDPADTNVHDSIALKLRVRAPTNAKSFSVSSFFYSSEYPEWVCSPYNDFYLMLLDSAFVPGAGQVANPQDKNLAFYDPPGAGEVYPVGVNLAFGGTGLFTVCQNSATGCGYGVAGSNTCASGTGQLTGTGFDLEEGPKFLNDPAYCQNNAKMAGGGTGWLTTNGNVKPGETIELRLVIWDTGDPWYDSLVLIDNFQWSLDASTPGTHQ